MKKVLHNGQVFDGEELHTGVVVVVEHDRVTGLVSEADIPRDANVKWDLEGHLLAPGLIDIQVNGGGGLMFNDTPTVETIRHMGAAHRNFGTTGFLPTLISSDFDTMEQAIAAVSQAIDEGVPGVLGVHLEGPFLFDVLRGTTLPETQFNLPNGLYKSMTLYVGPVDHLFGEQIDSLFEGFQIVS